MVKADVLVIGGGHAGGEVASELRRLGFSERILVVGDEVHPPYHRPPLSKDVLTTTGTPSPLLIRSHDFYASHAIDTCFGDPVVVVDLAARSAILESGRRIDFGKLVFATGGRCRDLDVQDFRARGIHTLRTFEDARELRSNMLACERVAIVGGGFIGLEVAAAARSLGREVIVVEAADLLLGRATSQEVGEMAHSRLVEAGVDVRLRESVRRIVVSDGRVTGLELNSGRIPAEVVVVGVGIAPNDELASAAGIPCDSGILIDVTGATDHEDVFAVGDCARVRPDESEPPSPGGTVEHAEHLAKCVAALIVGSSPIPRRVPWAWSDQGDFLYQRAGHLRSGDHIVWRTPPTDKSLAKLHFRNGELAGIEAVNCPADARAVRALLTHGLHLSPADAADPLRRLAPSTR
ncbi:NAD(P)/FAD-dependent oxidoreductase [Nocardia testacea]|uniref:NAD(P)/FAD-dependent oxidoreductase n=1 Tax=Nocardia testacea TaxID=248551 RepID=UPI003A87F063